MVLDSCCLLGWGTETHISSRQRKLRLRSLDMQETWKSLDNGVAWPPRRALLRMGWSLGSRLLLLTVLALLGSASQGKRITESSGRTTLSGTTPLGQPLNPIGDQVLASARLAQDSWRAAHTSSMERAFLSLREQEWARQLPQLPTALPKLPAALAKLSGGAGLTAFGQPKKAATCMGLVKKMCNACPAGAGIADPKLCKAINDECMSIFCLPLCRRITWTCGVTFGSFKEESDNKQFEASLCSQFIAKGCQDMMDCCPLDSELYDYIDNYAFFDNFPNPRFPSPNCLEATPENCNKCKAQVKVKLTPGVCPFPTMEGVKAPAKQFPQFLQLGDDSVETGRRAFRRMMGYPRARTPGMEAAIASAKAEALHDRRQAELVAERARKGADVGDLAMDGYLPSPQPQPSGHTRGRKKPRGAAPGTRVASGVLAPGAARSKASPVQQPSAFSNQAMSPQPPVSNMELQEWVSKDKDWQDKYDKFMELHYMGPGGAVKGGAKSGPKPPCGLTKGPSHMPGFPGCPAHTSIQERCEALLKKVKAKLPSMKSTFQNRVCKCMGCCKGGCFYPVLEEFPPGGEEEG